MNPDDPELDKSIQDRFSQLPPVVQDAITSADVQKQLRAVAANHKLHVDQWGKLENEVMLTLLGFDEPGNLEKNLVGQVGVPSEEARDLANDINTIVFEPIRQELERQLAHPEAQEKAVSAEEVARNEAIANEAAPSTDTPSAAPAGALEIPAAAPAPIVAPPGVLPATPPAPKPTEKAVRAPISSSYTSQQASTARKGVEGDPYRELP